MDSAEQAQDTPPLLLRCSVCLELRPYLHGSTCSDCVMPLLLPHWPRLVEVLEQRYGRLLDRWLGGGRFNDLSWEVAEKFTVPAETLRAFISKVIEDAVSREEIFLDPPGSCSWVPSETEELVEAVYSQCRTSLRQLITRHLVKAVKQAPTLKAERELIETVIGARENKAPNHLDDTISAAVNTTANPLPYPARVLTDIRYRPDRQGEMEFYSEFQFGEVDAVWREIADELPPDLVALIAAEDPE